MGSSNVSVGTGKLQFGSYGEASNIMSTETKRLRQLINAALIIQEEGNDAAATTLMRRAYDALDVVLTPIHGGDRPAQDTDTRSDDKDIW